MIATDLDGLVEMLLTKTLAGQLHWKRRVTVYDDSEHEIAVAAAGNFVLKALFNDRFVITVHWGTVGYEYDLGVLYESNQVFDKLAIAITTQLQTQRDELVSNIKDELQSLERVAN